jgi:UDP:flavonoid glycosyltransferase YjiC (YdhE family)
MALRVAWFVSNHGWGHLSRSMVAVDSLRRSGHEVLMAVAPEMVDRMGDLPGVEIVTGALDRGYEFGTWPAGADGARSRLLVPYAVTVDRQVQQRVQEWRPDVIAADATPWASSVATALGVPSVMCSNFSWDDQYAALFASDERLSDSVEAVRDLVEQFDLALTLPLGPGMPSIGASRAIPLVSRMPSRTPSTTEHQITWAFGGTPINEQPRGCLERVLAYCEARGISFAANDEVAGAYPTASRIPSSAYWPDVLARSRLVITKTGYSTVAETLRGSGHVLAFGITGLPEEVGMLAEIEERGYGRTIALGEAEPADLLIGHVEELLRRSPREPLSDDGCEVIEAALLEVCEG